MPANDTEPDEIEPDILGQEVRVGDPVAYAMGDIVRLGDVVSIDKEDYLVIMPHTKPWYSSRKATCKRSPGTVVRMPKGTKQREDA